MDDQREHADASDVLPVSVTLQAALDQAGTAVFIKSIDGRYLYANRSFASAAGRDAAHLLGRCDEEIFPEAVARAMRAADARVIESGADIESEIALRGKQDTGYWSIHRHPVRSDSGAIVAVAGLATDISNRRVEGMPSDLHVAYLNHLTNNPLSIAFLKDDLGRTVYVSPALLRRSGMAREQWLGKTVEEIFPAELAAAMTANDLAVLAKDQPMEVVEDTAYEPGTRQSWMMVKFPLRDRDGRRYIGAFGVDISARLQLERTLRERTEHFILPTFGSMIGSHDRDLRDHTLFMSTGIAQLLGIGHEPTTWTREQWLDVIHPDDRERNIARINDHLAGVTRNIDMQYRVRHRDGHYRWVWSLGVAQRDERGVPYRIVGALIDITDQKIIQEREQAQQRLTAVIAHVQQRLLADHTLEETFAELLDQLLALTGSEFGFIGEVMHDEKGAPYLKTHAISDITWNEASRVLYRSTAQNLEIRNLDSLFGAALTSGEPLITNDPPNDPRRGGLPHGHPPLTAFLALPFGSESRLLGMVGIANRPGGYDQAIIAYLEPLLSVCANVIASLRNRAARREAEEALRASEQRYRQLIELNPDAIHVFQDGRFAFANQAAVEVFGARDQDDLLSRSPWDFIHPSDVDTVKARVERIMERNWVAPVMESRIRTLDGAWKDVEMSGACVTFRGRPAVQTILRDISARKLARERELRSRRMESLGTLAGGVAHDFNNILAAILANVQTALQEVSPESTAAVSLEQVKLASERAASLVRQVLSFSRAATEKREPVALASVMREVLELLRPTIPALIEIRSRFPDDLPPVIADSSQLHQVAVNLISNAAHAIGRKAGAIDVDLAVLPVPNEVGESRQEVRLRIADDGAGMDDHTRERIFDPFFTTKRPGEGAGLGLSIVHEVVRTHGGRIEVTSTPGQGTVFDLFFPAAQVAMPQERQAPPPVPSRARRVLFLDDDALVNFAIHRVLTRAGHEVCAQLDPRLALELFRARPDDFDVLVVDLSMPGMGGLDFSRAARACRADVPIILSSGNFEPADEATAKELGIRRLLPKPYDIETLEMAILEA